MTFAEMIAEVYVLTNRPDLVAETALAVRKATIKMHSIDFFARDLVEVDLAVSPAAAQFQIDVTTNFPRFRSVAYVRDATGLGANTQNRFLQHMEPRELLDEYALERQNVWYQGGVMLNISSVTTITNILVGYYQNPIITPEASFDSWIALEQPYAIIEEAAATIFKMIGNAEMGRAYEQQSMQNILLLRQNYLEGVAR